jgi:hypothetical protein
MGCAASTAKGEVLFLRFFVCLFVLLSHTFLCVCVYKYIERARVLFSVIIGQL